MKARCLTRLSWPLISTGTSILQFMYYDDKNWTFYSTIFISSNEAQEGKDSVVPFPVKINDIHAKVVNALWNGELIQKNNENNEIDCE